MKRALTIPTAMIAFLTASQAYAQSIEVRMDNDETRDKMICQVYKIVNGQQTRYKRYTLGKKRPNDGRNARTFKFTAPLKSRTISGHNTYAKLKMECWNPKQQQSRYTSRTYVWDHTDKSFFDYYFSASCSAVSAPCSAHIKRKR